LRSAAHKFITSAQRKYISHFLETLLAGLEADMKPGTEREFVIDMDAVADQQANDGRPAFYYAEEAQQTRFSCTECNEFNDIRGRYGYCASCGARNNLATTKRTYEDIRERINQGHLPPDEAVKCSVSEFDASCRDYLTQLRKRVPMRQSRRNEFERLLFHDIESPLIATMKAMFDIDLLRAVGGEFPFLKMMMHRRHVYEHNAGVADDRYLRLSGDEAARAGVLIRETAQNVHRLINGLTRMASNLHDDFHEIFQLTPWPVKHYRERQERKRRR
jgi:hypothetical protein